MPKSAGRTNRLPKTNAASKLGQGRRKEKDPGSQRSAETIQRLKMYSNGKAIRNREGKVVAGAFMMKDRAGDRKIDASTGRIQPDRRWFGNTRVVGSTELDNFRQEMTDAVADPYSVVLKRKKVPMGLLNEVAEYTAGNKKAALLEQEPFDQAFGKQSQRKRVKLDQLFVGRSMEAIKNKTKADTFTGEGQASVVDKPNDEKDACSGYSALLSTAQKSQDTYDQINSQEGIVPWGRDSNLEKKEGEGVDWRHERKDDLFLKGQSKRIWGEFFKVVDCSDIVLHIIDARNVPGTRCTMIERHIQKNAPHKHLVFILNKVDLVPSWVAKRWMGELAAVRPTIAFHASMTHAFGKGALISLLRQFGKLHEDKKQISVGVIGYPNVGKSSVINTLISKKSCKVAPIPGETKIWQYVSLFKRISLIDCPGVVVDTAGDTEEDSVLKGVVRAERLENPQEFVDAILSKVKPEYIAAQYKLERDSWKSSEQLMELISQRSGRLLKGGEPCLRSSAIMIINDFQRGRLPHYVAPPELKSDSTNKVEDSSTDATATASLPEVKQNLDKIGLEHMNKDLAEEELSDGKPVAEQVGEATEQSEAPSATDIDAASFHPIGKGTQVQASASGQLIGEGEW
eukprot:CAMPEP_0172474042 /NCGR_PEP_ID=MMETSP1065-20121228/69158_1 /TAXON_ID=265537 /ORGANISM="Amphiprora paludosa, Strain CCMP125" /LENGTH=626 /DNA_ID=CAMNT_0013232219 /DNA_START=193 /DNA_END=2070 /DNA_ORIENTATION=+